MAHDVLEWIARRSIAVRAAVYVREVVRLRRRAPAAFDPAELVRRFRPWQRSLRPRSTPLADGQPWITYGAVQFVEQQLQPDMSVFEWGSGGSTLFFARRVREGFSVEHDATWGSVVRAELDRAGFGWPVEVIVPEPRGEQKDPARPQDYASDDPPFRSHSFRDYAGAIDRFPDERFDIVVIDGRARPSCALHAVAKVKRGGWLILDNADRPYYGEIHAQLAALGWTKRSFRGPGPYAFGFWETCAWQKP